MREDASFIVKLQNYHPLSANEFFSFFSQMEIAKGGYYSVFPALKPSGKR